MLAPEDNIDFNKKSIVYENNTYRQFENILKWYKYWELLSCFIIFTLLLGALNLTPYLVSFLLIFESDYTGTFLSPEFYDNYIFIVVYLALIISTYQVYKSIDNKVENQKIGKRFYIFQMTKIVIYLWSQFNLLLVFAIIGFIKMGIVIYYTKTKSFK